MLLTLYGLLMGVSFLLIALGFYSKEHTELSIVGFLFLFLLSFPLMSANIDYETGANVTSSYIYTGSQLTQTTQNIIYTTTPYTNKTLGYYLAVASIVGFIGVFLSLKKGRDL